MRAAKLESSDRLQRLRSVLRRGEWKSTRDLILEAQVMAISAAVCELRQNGIPIECERRGNAWYYRMVIEPQQLQLANVR